MKQIILSAVLAISGLTAAQKSKNFQTSEYESISISGPYTVVLTNGKEGAITATGEAEDLAALVVESENGKLRIRPEKGWKNKPKHKVTITVPFQEVSEVKLAGSGSITSGEMIATKSLNIAITGSGSIRLKAKADMIDASISGSGNLELSGNANKMKSNLAGSGEIHAFGLQSAIAEASISGSGHCQVYCTEQLTARVSGSGNIEYKGNPEKEDSKLSGSGRVTKA